jgi:RNA polymerase sigma-70 factor (ECF subfamily)
MHTVDTDLRAAVASLICHHGRKWRRYIVRILRNEADADDVIQEAVRRVLLRNRPLLSEEQVRMYLGRAISNAALTLYNHRKRERLKHTPLQEHSLWLRSNCCPHTYMEERERTQRQEKLLGLLNEGLMQLPLKQHEALRLTILESQGLSIRDAGATNGIPYSTLRHRSKQGLRQLRRFLEKSLRSAPPGKNDD